MKNSISTTRNSLFTPFTSLFTAYWLHDFDFLYFLTLSKNGVLFTSVVIAREH